MMRFESLLVVLKRKVAVNPVIINNVNLA